MGEVCDHKLTLEHVSTTRVSHRGWKAISKATFDSHKGVGKNDFNMKSRTDGLFDLGGNTIDNSCAKLKQYDGN